MLLFVSCQFSIMSQLLSNHHIFGLPIQSYLVILSHKHTHIHSLKHLTRLLVSRSPGLPGGPLPAPGVGGREAQPRRSHRATGPQRPQPGEGHLETRGVLPQRQAGRVPVRDGAQRPREDQSQRSHPLHA